eukprot:gene20761-biopygen17142
MLMRSITSMSKESTAEENFDEVQDDGISEQQSDDIGIPEQLNSRLQNAERNLKFWKRRWRLQSWKLRYTKSKEKPTEQTKLGDNACEPEEDEEMDISDNESLYENEDESDTEYIDETEIRHITAVLHFNENLLKEVKKNKDGSIRYAVSYPKFKNGEATVRELRIPSKFGNSLEQEQRNLKQATPAYMNTMLTKECGSSAIQKKQERQNMTIYGLAPVVTIEEVDNNLAPEVAIEEVYPSSILTHQQNRQTDFMDKRMGLGH